MARWHRWRLAGRGESAPLRQQPDQATPLPSKDMMVIFLTHVSQGFQVTMLFPLIVFMVTDFGVAEHHPHLIGRYAGFLASLFPFAQFCTSLLWGSVSDRVGRKPVLVFGNVVASVSAVLFGLSGNYTMACLVRLIGGFLNGVITVTKTTLGELCDKTNQRQGFAVLSLGWGIGTIAGQVIGGVAARPCQQYGIEHCPPILRDHPFILPCIGAAFFSAVAAVATFFLTETLNRSGFVRIDEEALELVEAPGGFVGGLGRGSGDASLSEEKSAGLGVFLEGLGGSRETVEESALLKRSVVSDDRLAIGVEDKSGVAARLSTNRGASESLQEEKFALVSRGLETAQKEVSGRVWGSTETATVGEDTRGEAPAVVLATGVCGNAETIGGEMTAEGLRNKGAADVETGFSYCESGEPLLMEGGSGETHAVGRGQKVNGLEYGKLPDLETGSEGLVGMTDMEQESTSRKDRFYLQDPDVWIASGTYGMTAFIHIIGDELFPIFSAAPVASGGLGYSASSIGILGGLSGAVLFLFTILFLKVNPRSARQCFTLGTLLVLPAFLLMPLTSLLPQLLTLQWWLVALLLIEKNIAACMGFTGAMVLVSNSSDSSNMGAITGFSHSLGAFARAAGPFLGGSMWSFSVALRVPFSQFIPWEVITFLTLVTLLLAVLAKPYLDSPKSDRSSL